MSVPVAMNTLRMALNIFCPSYGSALPLRLTISFRLWLDMSVSFECIYILRS